MSTDNEFKQLNNDCCRFVVEQLAKNLDPLEVAAIMVTQALSLYRSSLSDDDFAAMMDAISESRDRIPVVQPINLH